MPQNLPVTLPGELESPEGSLLRLLLERMQDVYSFCELRHVKDPVLYGRTNSQLVNARAHARHGLPVIRLKPLLHQVQLVTCNAPGVVWEGSQIFEG